MVNLPGYDAWKTNDPRDRDYELCECGGEMEEHEDVYWNVEPEGLHSRYRQACHHDAACSCTGYVERDASWYADRAEDAAVARWERSVGR